MEGFTREVARRIFAQELRDSDLSFRENDDQYAPLYLVIPTGARCNRVFVVGSLVERDNIGEDVEYWRGRVVDPTGSILVYAGQYQPDAARVLAETEPPSFVAVVGKPSVYETDDGTRIISVRAESVQKVDAASKDRWNLETAGQTLARIGAFREFLDQGGPEAFSGEEVPSDQPQASDFKDIGKAYLHYDTDLNRYRSMVVRALESLAKGDEGVGETIDAETDVVEREPVKDEPGEDEPFETEEIVQADDEKPREEKDGGWF